MAGTTVALVMHLLFVGISLGLPSHVFTSPVWARALQYGRPSTPGTVCVLPRVGMLIEPDWEPLGRQKRNLWEPLGSLEESIFNWVLRVQPTSRDGELVKCYQSQQQNAWDAGHTEGTAMRDDVVCKSRG